MTVTISGYGRRFQVAGVALVLVAIALAIFARPAGAAITATATPSTGLGQTGTIAVTASGFDTNLNSVIEIMCQHGATDSSLCDANTAVSDLSANFEGNFSDPAYTYYALPDDALGVSNIVCDADNPCDLVLIQDDYNNFSNPHIELPLSFDFVHPSTTTTSTTQPVVTSTTTIPVDATTLPVGDTTVPGETTTSVSGTTGSASTTTVHGAGTTGVAGQGTAGTLPSDPSGGGSIDTSGGQLPFTGPPTAAPIVAVCGLVILFAGTLMRRVVLRVPDAGVTLS